jgi:hypothetical protein
VPPLRSETKILVRNNAGASKPRGHLACREADRPRRLSDRFLPLETGVMGGLITPFSGLLRLCRILEHREWRENNP